MSEISILDVNFDSESNVFKELKYPDALNGYYNGSKLKKIMTEFIKKLLQNLRRKSDESN